MLINCVAYQGGKKLGDIGVSEIHEYADKPDCFVWVALRDADAEELEQMKHEFGLHDLAVEDAHYEKRQRPKIEEYGDTLFAVMTTLDVVDGEILQGEVDVFVGENYALSVRNDSQQGFLDVRERSEREPHLLRKGPAFVLSTHCWMRLSTATFRSCKCWKPRLNRWRSRFSYEGQSDATWSGFTPSNARSCC